MTTEVKENSCHLSLGCFRYSFQFIGLECSYQSEENLQFDRNSGIENSLRLKTKLVDRSFVLFLRCKCYIPLSLTSQACSAKKTSNDFTCSLVILVSLVLSLFNVSEGLSSNLFAAAI